MVIAPGSVMKEPRIGATTMMESHQEHARIVNAIRAGDEAAAIEALTNNIQ